MFQTRSKFCPRCKQKYRTEDEFCGNCGSAVTRFQDNIEKVGVLDIHGLDRIPPVSSSKPAYVIKQRNLRRFLFFLMIFLIVVATFILGIDIEKSTVVVPSTSQTALIYTFPVNSAQSPPGLNTHINLVPSDRLIIIASGSASYCPCSNLLVDPDGTGIGNGKVNNSIYPSAFVGTLLGSIGQVGSQGSTGWFIVGSHYSSTVSVSGQLYLIVNDSQYDDNKGSYQITVVVKNR